MNDITPPKLWLFKLDLPNVLREVASQIERDLFDSADEVALLADINETILFELGTLHGDEQMYFVSELNVMNNERGD